MAGHVTIKETLNYLRIILIWLLILKNHQIETQMIHQPCTYMLLITKKMPWYGNTLHTWIQDKRHLKNSRPKLIKNRVSFPKQWISRKYSSSFNPQILILICMLKKLSQLLIKEVHLLFQKQEESKVSFTLEHKREAILKMSWSKIYLKI